MRITSGSRLSVKDASAPGVSASPGWCMCSLPAVYLPRKTQQKYSPQLSDGAIYCRVLRFYLGTEPVNLCSEVTGPAVPQASLGFRHARHHKGRVAKPAGLQSTGLSELVFLCRPFSTFPLNRQSFLDSSLSSVSGFRLFSFKNTLTRDINFLPVPGRNAEPRHL